MIFPIGDDQVKGGHFPFFSYGFIVLNVVIYFMQTSSGTGLLEYAAVPANIMAGEDYLTLLTSIFMHGSLMHLIGNMLFLWVFADNIEATVGSFSFLGFYLLGGLIASAAHIGFNMSSMIPTLGASGAISAVLGAYLVVFPKSRVKVFFFFLFFRLPAFIFLGFWIIQQFISANAAHQGVGGDGVAWWAHIGGFIFGVLAGYFIRKSKYRYSEPAAEHPGTYV